MAPASTMLLKPPNSPASTITGTANSHLASHIALRASANENFDRSAPHRMPCTTLPGHTHQPSPALYPATRQPDNAAHKKKLAPRIDAAFAVRFIYTEPTAAGSLRWSAAALCGRLHTERGGWGCGSGEPATPPAARSPASGCPPGSAHPQSQRDRK